MPAKKAARKTGRKQPAKRPLPDMISTKEVVELLGISRERINQLIQSGYIRKGGRDKYPLSGSVQGYISFLKDEDRRGQKGQAQARVADARTKQLDLKNAKEEGKLVDLIEVEDLFAEITGTYVAALSGLAAQITRNIPERKRIEKIIDRQRAVLETRFIKSGKNLLAGRAAVGANRKKPARRVGPKK